MRTPHSRSPAPVERLQAMDIRDNSPETGSENSYVQVDEHAPAHSQVSIQKTEEWEKELMQDPKNRLALAALTTHEPNSILISRNSTLSNTQSFNIKIPFEGAPITNQNHSGRCWLFAATNVFRVAIMRKYNLKKFELSQSYLFYWDKLEKANWFLEQIVDTAKEDLDGREVQALLDAPVGDGGQWDMVANLVRKYGLVPQALFPDSFNAKNSATMDHIITAKLREYALELRSLATSSSSSLSSTKEYMMREIHLILTLLLGQPPSPTVPFTWEYHDKEDIFHSETCTPLGFASTLSTPSAIAANAGTDVHRLFSLVNDPRNAYGSLLTVSRLGNVIGGRGITYVNVDMTTMKMACIEMLSAGIPIFFGSDVGKFSDGTSGIMDTDLMDYELGFNVRLGMDKAQRLRTGESKMTHAMVLTAVHVVDGKSVRWRVQNSWGDKVGTEGWFVMSDRWMDEFVYQAVVDPSFVSDEVKKVLDMKPIVLPLWDPMGALA